LDLLPTRLAHLGQDYFPFVSKGGIQAASGLLAEQDNSILTTQSCELGVRKITRISLKVGLACNAEDTRKNDACSMVDYNSIDVEI